jgi:hypothetical protein
LNSDGEDRVDPATGDRLSERIHQALFADTVESTEDAHV